MRLENKMVVVRDANDPRDPYYIPKKTGYVCCECREDIQCGDEYIENENGEYIHVECIPSSEWLIGWLGYKIKRLEEDYADDE